MVVSSYTIKFVASNAKPETVKASKLVHAHDGSLSWLIFSDDLGEVCRVRSTNVLRVDRTG